MKNLIFVFAFVLVFPASSAQAQTARVRNEDMGELRQKAWGELFESKPVEQINATIDESPSTVAPAEKPVTPAEQTNVEVPEEPQPIVNPSRLRRQMRLDRAVEKRERQEELEKGMVPQEDNPRLNFKGDGRLRRESRRERTERIKQIEAQDQAR